MKLIAGWLVLITGVLACAAVARWQEKPPPFWRLVPCDCPPARPLPQPPGESPEPPLAVADPDDALFQRLRDRIDKRVEQRLVDSFEEAASDDKKGVVPSLLAAAIGRLVKKLVEALVIGLVTAALVALAWKYWWVIATVYGTAATAGWLGSKANRTAGGTGNAKSGN